MSQANHTAPYEQLSTAERIELLQRLWDEISESPDQVELTDAQRAELDRRVEDYRRDSDAGTSWSSRYSLSPAR